MAIVRPNLTPVATRIVALNRTGSNPEVSPILTATSTSNTAIPISTYRDHRDIDATLIKRCRFFLFRNGGRISCLPHQFTSRRSVVEKSNEYKIAAVGGSQDDPAHQCENEEDHHTDQGRCNCCVHTYLHEILIAHKNNPWLTTRSVVGYSGAKHRLLRDKDQESGRIDVVQVAVDYFIRETDIPQQGIYLGPVGSMQLRFNLNAEGATVLFRGRNNPDSVYCTLVLEAVINFQPRFWCHYITVVGKPPVSDGFRNALKGEHEFDLHSVYAENWIERTVRRDNVVRNNVGCQILTALGSDPREDRE